MGVRGRVLVGWTVISTLTVEAITACLGFRGGVTAPEFNETAPFLLQSMNPL